MPLEDYLITNRDESFVNAKVVEERGVEVYGLKRDDLAKLNRRGIIEIAPERLAKGRSGEGLCPGEPFEFSVTEVQIIDGHLIGVVTNLSKTPWNPWIDVEVTARGRRRGKFQIEDPVVHAPLPNVLAHGESTSIDQSVPLRLLKELERIKDADSGVGSAIERSRLLLSHRLSEYCSPDSPPQPACRLDFPFYRATSWSTIRPVKDPSCVSS